jgi:hypothetical protein
MVTKWITTAVVVLLLARSANAQWKPPLDGKFTEDQLKIFLDTQKDWLDENAKILQDVSTAQTDATRLAALGDLDKRYQACLERHHMSRQEFEWLAQQAMAAWTSVTYIDQTYKNTNDELDSQTRENAIKLADAQSRLAKYQQAQKDGVRVMSADDRDEAIKSAKEDQQSALDEAKQHGDDAVSAEAEAKQQTKDAGTAQYLAGNPPADISADDRPAYMDNKTNEAQTARDAAKDALSRKEDAVKAQDDALFRAQVAAHKAAHPEIPANADEKASVKADNDTGVAVAQGDIAECQQQSVQLTAGSQQLKNSAQQMRKNIPEENIVIMRKYADRYHHQLAHAVGNGATTQPAK